MGGVSDAEPAGRIFRSKGIAAAPVVQVEVP